MNERMSSEIKKRIAEEEGNFLFNAQETIDLRRFLIIRYTRFL